MSAHTRLLKNTAILNMAASDWFSSDRTITEYAKEIWDAKPCLIEP